MTRLQPATDGYTRERTLSLSQAAAIDLLILGKGDRETAEAIGVNRVTVTRWRLYDPWFIAELNRRRQEIWGAGGDRKRSLVLKALDTLEAEMREGDHRVQAATVILRLAGADKIGGPPQGVTDATSVLDEMVRAKRPDLLAELTAGVSDQDRLEMAAELERRITAPIEQSS